MEMASFADVYQAFLAASYVKNFVLALGLGDQGTSVVAVLVLTEI